MNTFEYKLSKRLFYLLVYFGIAAGLFLSHIKDKNIDGLFISGLPVDWATAILILVFILTQLMISFHFVALGIYQYTLSIDLADDGILFNAKRIFPLNIKFFKKRHFPGKVSYAEVRNMEIKNGILQIQRLGNKPIPVEIRTLEDTALFINTLKIKFPKDRLTLNLDDYRTANSGERARNMFSLTMFFLMIVIFAADSYLEFKKSRIWGEEFSSSAVKSISIDKDRTIWSAVEYYNRGNVIWHIQEDQRQHWVLPESVCTERDCDSAYVGHDEMGNPAVVIADDGKNNKTLYQFKNGKWESIIADVYFPYDDIVGYDNVIWGMKGEDLIKIDIQFSGTKITKIKTSDQLGQLDLRLDDYKILPDGGLIAEYYDESSETQYITIYHNDSWEQIVKFEITDIFIQEFTQDTNGNLWALSSEDSTGNRFLGSFDENANQWVWTKLDFDVKMKYVAFFRDFVFDNEGRLWISGVYEQDSVGKSYTNFVWVISNRGKYLLEAEYTEENSNLPSSVDSLMPANNFVWHQGYDLGRMDITKSLAIPLSQSEMTWMEYVLLRYFVLVMVFGLGYLATSPWEISDIQKGNNS